MWYNDFPYWLRFAHFINLIFLTLLIRSGIEILSAMPKLYWHDHATPGTEWIKFTKKVFPANIKERIWISLEEEESFSSWVALPGHKNLGIGRYWHFFCIIFWIANGAAYYILLFTSDEWQRLIPTSWSILPGALHTGLMYLSLHFPPDVRSDTKTFVLCCCLYTWTLHDCYRGSNVTSDRCSISQIS
jgi:methionine sulfoxide reductase catalytic subunit